MELEQLYRQYLDAGGQVSTDTRRITPGALFFALKGERFDGNQFVARALDAGASLAVVDDPQVAGDKERYMLVPEVLPVLQALATHHRRQFGIPVLALTGSNGKTTTKELIAGVLASHYRTHATGGNFNNHIGVPLTLLAMPLDTEIAVIEMGANRQGEIAALSAIAEPTHGLITNIGKAHLEGFGGIEGVKKGKSELYRFLESTDGVAFVNEEERFLKDLSEGVRNRVFYRFSARLDPRIPQLEMKVVAEQPTLEVAFLDKGEERQIRTQLTGAYNLGNIATAIAVGRYFKVPGMKIRQAIEAYHPENNRSELRRLGSNLLILDAYNANPTSMEAALRNLSRRPESRKVAVIGDMLELGEDAGMEHRRIGRLAKELGIEEIVLVGPLFEATAGELGLRHFPDVAALKAWFDPRRWEQAVILLKASRGIGLERVLA